MILSTLKQFNWVDILVVVVLIRVCWAAVKGGFLAELFKILGTICATYLALHYYIVLSDSVRGQIPSKNIPLDFLDFVFFVILAITGYLLFVVIRQAILKFINMEPIPQLNKWGGLVLGLVRAFLLNGLLIFMFLISSISYLKNSVANSYSGEYFSKIAVGVYSSLWNGITSKFMAKEKFNETVIEATTFTPAKD